MVRIVDKNTRLIDIDFGPVNVGLTRTAGAFLADSVTFTGNGFDQVLSAGDINTDIAGSFIQYEQIDLSFMTSNGEVMQPTEVSIQRTSPVPLGFHLNGNNHEQIEEFIFVLSRPLDNRGIIAAPNAPVSTFRAMGLPASEGGPTHQQTIYAEKRMYSYSTNLGASITNGELNPPPLNPTYHSLYGMPVLDNVTTWGTLSAITGPQLHVYRVVILRNQSLVPSVTGLWPQEGLDGSSSIQMPPVNITFLCKDPNYTEGEYLTRLANAMNTSTVQGEII